MRVCRAPRDQTRVCRAPRDECYLAVQLLFLSGARHTSLLCEKHMVLLKRPLQESQAGNILGERVAKTQRTNLDAKTTTLGPHAEEQCDPQPLSHTRWQHLLCFYQPCSDFDREHMAKLLKETYANHLHIMVKIANYKEFVRVNVLLVGSRRQLAKSRVPGPGFKWAVPDYSDDPHIVDPQRVAHVEMTISHLGCNVELFQRDRSVQLKAFHTAQSNVKPARILFCASLLLARCLGKHFFANDNLTLSLFAADESNGKLVKYYEDAFGLQGKVIHKDKSKDKSKDKWSGEVTDDLSMEMVHHSAVKKPFNISEGLKGKDSLFGATSPRNTADSRMLQGTVVEALRRCRLAWIA